MTYARLVSLLRSSLARTAFFYLITGLSASVVGAIAWVWLSKSGMDPSSAVQTSPLLAATLIATALIPGLLARYWVANLAARLDTPASRVFVVRAQVGGGLAGFTAAMGGAATAGMVVYCVVTRTNESRAVVESATVRTVLTVG
jgi:hypothetical protein